LSKLRPDNRLAVVLDGAALMGGMGRTFHGGIYRVRLGTGQPGGAVSQRPLPHRLPAPGARLAACSGGAADLPPRLLRDFLDAVAAATALVPIGHVYHFDQIVQTHADMEASRTSGKLVVTT
jgi:hypothetical protein